MTPEELARWVTFVKWAHARKYLVNLYRPKNIKSIYFDYRIQLKLQSKKVLIARKCNLNSAITDIKNQLLALMPLKK